MRLTVEELAKIVDGVVAGTSSDADVTSFTIDSRTVVRGACFVALRDTRDGHDFVVDAFARGATVALVDRDVEEAPGPLVRIDDPLDALARLARAARSRFEGTVVGITGSAGKTATKDLVAAATAGTRRIHASPESYNNESGVPLTMLGAADDVEVVLAEMGARREGDLTVLCEIVRPEIGAVTNVGLAHAGPFGGVEGVVRAKGELVEALPSGGLAVLNADDPNLGALAGRTSARVLTVGEGKADIVFRNVRIDEALRPTLELETPWGSGDVSLAVRGAHQAANAAMACAIALVVGVGFDAALAGLATARTASHRMELFRSSQGLWILDDAYNANPASAQAALRAFAELPAKRRIAVLGEMLELGAASAREHRRLGAFAAALGIDVVVAVGPGAREVAEGASETEVVRVENGEEATAFVIAQAKPGDAVLVKASRAIGLESIVTELLGGAT